jgi:uncharacterized membrane protein
MDLQSLNYKIVAANGDRDRRKATKPNPDKPTRKNSTDFKKTLDICEKYNVVYVVSGVRKEQNDDQHHVK